jgi:hypothetical protein
MDTDVRNYLTDKLNCTNFFSSLVQALDNISGNTVHILAVAQAAIQKLCATRGGRERVREGGGERETFDF